MKKLQFGRKSPELQLFHLKVITGSGNARTDSGVQRTNAQIVAFFLLNIRDDSWLTL
jgi:hypothetical protein